MPKVTPTSEEVSVGKAAQRNKNITFIADELLELHSWRLNAEVRAVVFGQIDNAFIDQVEALLKKVQSVEEEDGGLYDMCRLAKDSLKSIKQISWQHINATEAWDWSTLHGPTQYGKA